VNQWSRYSDIMECNLSEDVNYWPIAADKPNATLLDIEHLRRYHDVHKIELSKTLTGTELINTERINGDITEKIMKIKQQGSPDNSLFGSPSATYSLMQQNLIDGYWLFVNPIILWQGIPLFVSMKEKNKITITK
jgi:hypothetical protein